MREKHRNMKRFLFGMMLCLFLLITQNVFAGVQSIQPDFISPISVSEQESGSEEIVDAEENSGLGVFDLIEQLIAALKAFKENAEIILGSVNAFVDGDDAAASSAIAASDEIFNDFNALYDQLEDVAGSAKDGAEKKKSDDLIFGSKAKPEAKLRKQMEARGWTEESVKYTVDNPFTTRKSVNRATGNDATAYYNKDGSYVIVDNVTNEIVQVSDCNDPDWVPDPDIVNPYIPKKDEK